MIPYRMKLTGSNFQLIQKGKKTIEIRLFDEKRKKLKIGDEIVFTNINDENQKIKVIVKDLITAENFETLFNGINLVDAGWNTNDTAEIAANDMLKYYSANQIKENGVLAILFN